MPIAAVGRHYAAGERFRLVITDNNDGTATISYVRLDGRLQAGDALPEHRARARARRQSAIRSVSSRCSASPARQLSNVTMVYIKDTP